MANQPETNNYDSGVYQIETTDAVQGGLGGVVNAPLLNLANRTKWLYGQVQSILTALMSVAGISGTTTTGNLAAFANTSGTIKNGPAVSSNTGTVAAVSGATTAGRLATFADAAGTVEEGPAVSSATGTVVAASGAFTAGHVLVAADSSGTATDGGPISSASSGIVITVANAGQTLSPGIYAVDTTGGAFAVNLTSTIGGAYTFYDYQNWWGVNNFTINGNGNNIGNTSSDVSATFLADVSDYEFTIVASSTYWRLV